MSTKPKQTPEELAEHQSELQNLEEAIDNFDEDEVIDFAASNNDPADIGFIERSKYRDEAYPLLQPLPTPIDTWYNKGLYGKVDTDYNSIITTDQWILDTLITPSIKTIPSGEEEIFAMNFVVDAFVDFQAHMSEAANLGDIHTKGSAFVPITPKGGWRSGENQYKEYLIALYEGFAGAFLEQNQHYKKVTDFKDFIKTFSDFLDTTMPDFPLSKSGFVLSHNFPLSATGLAIEIADQSFGDDAPKYNDFITDKNFSFYLGAAQQFGFRVDKNAPWRLVADIKSNKMQEYMRRYPEEPVKPIEPGEVPPTPCELATNTLFAEYVGRKIEFTQPLEGDCSLGKIENIICNSPNWSAATFQIRTYEPGSDEDLLDAYPPAEGEVKIQWGGGLPATGLTAVSPTRDFLRVISLEDIYSNKPTWLNIPFRMNYVDENNQTVLWQNYSPRLAEIGSYPILLDPSQSRGVDEYRWKIESAPRGDTGVFMQYAQTEGEFWRQMDGEFIPSPMSSDRSDGKPNIASVGSTKGGRIRFRPSKPGTYVFSVEGFNMQIEGVPRSLGKKFLQLKFCEFVEDDVPPAPPGTYHMSSRVLFRLVKQATSELWQKYSERLQPQLASRTTENVLLVQTPTGQKAVGLIDYAPHVIPHLSNQDVLDIQAGASYVNDPNWVGFGQGWFLNFLIYLRESGIQAPLSISGEPFSAVSLPYTDTRFRGNGGAICDAYWDQTQSPHEPQASVQRTFGEVFRNYQAKYFDPYYDNHMGPSPYGPPHYRYPQQIFPPETHIARSQSAPPTRTPVICTRTENWAYVLALLSITIRNGFGVQRTINKDTIPGGASLGRQYPPLEWIDAFGQKIADTEAVSILPDQPNALTYWNRWAFDDRVIRGVNRTGGVATAWMEDKQIYVTNTSFYEMLLGREYDGTFIPGSRTEPMFYKTAGVLSEDEKIFNSWWESCRADGVDNSLDVTLEFSATPCSLTPSRNVEIILSPNTATEDYFILSEDNNLEFQKKRDEYKRAVIDYPFILNGYNERVEAMNTYIQTLSLWQDIQDRGAQLSFDNLFKRQFQKTLLLDIPVLKKYTLDVYNSYVLSHEWLVTTKFKKDGEGTFQCMKKRETITMAEMEELYPDAFWTKFYFNLRIMESRKQLDATQLKTFHLKAANILLSNPSDGMTHVLRIIDEEIKGVLEEKLSLTQNSLYDTI